MRWVDLSIIISTFSNVIESAPNTKYKTTTIKFRAHSQGHAYTCRDIKYVEWDDDTTKWQE